MVFNEENVGSSGGWRIQNKTEEEVVSIVSDHAA